MEMEYLSDDEDVETEYMEVDIPYLSDDVELLTDDEDDIVRIMTPKSLQMTRGGIGDLDLSKAVASFADNCLKEVSPLKPTNYSDGGFPAEYKYLLTLPAINETALRQFPDLYSLLFTKQTTVVRIIEHVTAILCLLWANDYKESSRPLLKDVTLVFKQSKIFKSHKDSSKRCTEINFGVNYTTDNCHELRGRSIRRSMVVLLIAKDGQTLTGRVGMTSANYCEISIRCEFADEREALNFDNLTVNIYEVIQEFLPKSMLKSIEGIRAGFLNHIVLPKPHFQETHQAYVARKNRGMSEFMRRCKISQKLTESQRNAVFAICENEHNEFPFVLFGPPGTGKTFTISQAIQGILRKDKNNRVLVCTMSNMAANRVAEQLMADFGDVLNEQNVLRLRATSNDYYQRDRQFEKIYSCDPDLALFTIPSNFDKWRVVVCTLGCSSHISNMNESRGFFSHIFVDEAGQSLEADIWIPIGSLANPNTSVILCGDPKQLGPVIKLDISKNLQNRFISTLVRYMDMDVYQDDTRLCCQLVDCFRCPKAVISIVSHLFYDTTLNSTPRGPDNFDYSKLEMNAKVPMLFISVESQEVRETNGFSFCNPIEAQICVEYINFLITKKGVLARNIAVISPYKCQHRYIIGLMNKRHNKRDFGDVLVNSVEGLQGSERDVIIMTATRTNHLGFMADDLRVNTSLTRVKKQLFVIGNERALNNHASWRRFIRYCREVGAYKQWNFSRDPSFVDDDVYAIENLSQLKI